MKFITLTQAKTGRETPLKVSLLKKDVVQIRDSEDHRTVILRKGRDIIFYVTETHDEILRMLEKPRNKWRTTET